MSGPLVKTSLVDVVNGKVLVNFDRKFVGERDFGSSIMYDAGKVLVVGGHQNPPTPTAEVIDLNDATPEWKLVGPMSIPRRQLNATLLADGKVLVTGGTNGFGTDDQNFNDLKKPIFFAELWDPATGKWSVMASASVPRQYHSTAVLLPDATVLSAAGASMLRPTPTAAPTTTATARSTPRLICSMIKALPRVRSSPAPGTPSLMERTSRSGRQPRARSSA